MSKTADACRRLLGAVSSRWAQGVPWCLLCTLLCRTSCEAIVEVIGECFSGRASRSPTLQRLVEVEIMEERKNEGVFRFRTHSILAGKGFRQLASGVLCQGAQLYRADVEARGVRSVFRRLKRWIIWSHWWASPNKCLETKACTHAF